MSEKNNAASAAQQSADLPPFYRRPVPLDAAAHAKAGLGERKTFEFARQTNAVVIAGAEFARAALHYPIVFSASAPVVPFVIVGLRDHDNLFVTAEGQWLDGSYVPAYVRRYPFIFVAAPNSDQLILCVDEAADSFEKDSAQPFFIDAAPGPGVQEVLRFCESFQVQHEDSLLFGRWLEENDMLEDRVARAELGDGAVFTLRGFRLVNPEKLRTLKEEQVLHLHMHGWLPLLHFHLQSLQNWGRLGKLMRERETAPPKAG